MYPPVAVFGKSGCQLCESCKEKLERLGVDYTSHDIEKFLWGLGCAVVFIYRDLRDVAVSLTHHIVTEGGSHSHPEWYEILGFDGALSAVIEGLHRYSGVIDRWEEYAGWLDVDWVLPIKFEDMRERPEEVAEEIFFYLIERTCEIRNESYRASKKAEDLYKRMADATRKRDQSPTFRKGVVGGWKDEFTYEAGKLFVEHGGHEWLVKLGYEDGD